MSPENCQGSKKPWGSAGPGPWRGCGGSGSAQGGDTVTIWGQPEQDGAFPPTPMLTQAPALSRCPQAPKLLQDQHGAVRTPCHLRGHPVAAGDLRTAPLCLCPPRVCVRDGERRGCAGRLSTEAT